MFQADFCVVLSLMGLDHKPTAHQPGSVPPSHDVMLAFYIHICHLNLFLFKYHLFGTQLLIMFFAGVSLNTHSLIFLVILLIITEIQLF